jgi:hypothetical protein
MKKYVSEQSEQRFGLAMCCQGSSTSSDIMPFLCDSEQLAAG